MQEFTRLVTKVMRSHLVMIRIASLALSCQNAGQKLLVVADQSLKEGNFVAALLNINQFFKQYPASPD